MTYHNIPTIAGKKEFSYIIGGMVNDKDILEQSWEFARKLKSHIS